MTLAELASKYQTDKLTEHGYIPFYQDLFDNLKIKVTSLLEIGIGYKDLMGYPTGASLKMWRDFFPDAMIYGFDIDRRAMIVGEPRIRTFHGNQAEAVDLVEMTSTVVHPFDVIIDDGSHLMEHQIYTANFLLPHLSKGGVYVIEDIACIHDLQRALGEGEIFEFNKRFDDKILLIRR